MALGAITVIKYLGCFSNILCNSFLIFALQRRKKLKIISYWLIFCLSCSDVFFGIFGLTNQSLMLTLVNDYWMYNIWMVINALEYFFASFSATYLLIIAIDRFIHMKHTLRYQSIMTKNVARFLVCFNVIFTVHIVTMVMLLPAFQSKFIKKHLYSYLIYRFVLSLVYIVVVLSVCILYIATYCSIKRRIGNAPDRSKRGNNITKRSDIYKDRRRPDQEFSICIMLIIILVLLFEAPNLCASVYINVSRLFQLRLTFSKELGLFLQWTYLLLQFNSSLNAVVLLILCRELRKFTRNVFKRSVTSDIS